MLKIGFGRILKSFLVGLRSELGYNQCSFPRSLFGAATFAATFKFEMQYFRLLFTLPIS
jgi:hypothetical protein